jgi:membrane-bound metal-dependent hydrolase YbcI (DUF457 family)
MITGHYATALVPYARDGKLPLFALLLASQAQDFLIPLDVQLAGQRSLRLLEMTYSHDLVPSLLLAAAVGLVLQLIYRDRKVSLIGVALVVLHEICDLLSGFAHNVFGPGTMRFGFDFYRTGPAIAYSIELLLAVGCLIYFFAVRRRRGDPVAPVKAAVLCLVILGPIAAALGLALAGRTIL